MFRKIADIILLSVTAVTSFSCDDRLSTGGEQGPVQTLLLYSAGYNNLSRDLQEDIDDICESYVPEGNRRNSDNLFVLAHHSDRSYSDGKPPCLIKIYRYDGTVYRDTVMTFPTGTSAIDTDVLNSVLSYIKENYPSDEYGMIFSSHATGWIPPNFSLTGSSFFSAARVRGSAGTASGQERSIGQDAGTGEEFDVKDFAAAIPFKLDYIIFDACLVGGIEVAYEMKDVCDYLVFSQTEILADGMVYTNITRRLLEENPANLVGVAEDFYNHYNSSSGQYRSATISVVDCSGLEELASVCKEIFDAHMDELTMIDASEVQAMRKDMYWFPYFYDFRDIIVHAGMTDEESGTLDAELKKCILYKAHTEYFIGTEINTCSGLSMYLPTAVRSASTRRYLDSYYQDFKWNQATGYVLPPSE